MFEGSDRCVDSNVLRKRYRYSDTVGCAPLQIQKQTRDDDLRDYVSVQPTRTVTNNHIDTESVRSSQPVVSGIVVSEWPITGQENVV